MGFLWAFLVSTYLHDVPQKGGFGVATVVFNIVEEVGMAWRSQCKCFLVMCDGLVQVKHVPNRTNRIKRDIGWSRWPGRSVSASS